jgi:hypothetical protein
MERWRGAWGIGVGKSRARDWGGDVVGNEDGGLG